MSSTNRSNARDSHVSDYYITPKQDIIDFMNLFLENHPELETSDLHVLDPCAWWDTNNLAAYPNALQEFWFENIISMDIREDSRATYRGYDFLSSSFVDRFDITITNPPFSHALPIIEKALDITRDDWYVIMLLRLNFFGSKARREFFRNHMPVECYIHHKRISFANGATDSIEYAHFVWRPGHNPDFTKTYLI